MEAPKGNFLYDLVLPKVDALGWLFTVTGLLLRFALRPSGEVLLMVGFGTLAIAWYLRAFEPPTASEEDRSELPADGFLAVVAGKVRGIAGATALIGILFKLLYWKGAATMLLVSVPLLLLVATWQASIGSLTLPTILVAGLALLAWAVPTEVLARQLFRDDPALAEQMVVYQQHPHDRAIKEKTHRLLNAWRRRKH